ncbi:helicase associated domain-containing protein [Kitasatospora sp. NPDC003701]
MRLVDTGPNLLAPPGSSPALLLQCAEHCRLVPSIDPGHDWPADRSRVAGSLPDRPGQRTAAKVSSRRLRRGSPAPRRRRARARAQDTVRREWERMYAVAAAFAAEHGHLDPAGNGVDRELAHWVARQRHLYGEARLRPIWISRLAELGMIWNDDSNAWERGLAYARAFATRTGHLAIPVAQTLDGYPLGTWMAAQRRANKLTKHRQKALDALDSLWRLEPGWNRSYRRMTAYLAAGGTLTGPANRTAHPTDPHFHPGAWLCRQTRRAADKKLNQQQIELLNSLSTVRST